MDIHEQHNSEPVGKSQAPEKSAPVESSREQRESSKSAVDAAHAENDQVSSTKTLKAPSQNHDGKPGALPDDTDELKSLVKKRDKIIIGLRSRNEELQTKLAEKEKVVTALTSRLEQAAEQLDRIRRSGADRGGKILSGIPAEVIDEQRELINDLKAALQQWEDLQSTSAMGRFEAQIGELREMLSEQLELKHRIDRDVKTSAGFKASTPGSQKSSWDEMKAQLLGDSASATHKISSDVMIPGAELEEPGSAEVPAGKSKFAEKYESEYVIDIPDRPAKVENFDEADAETLRTAVKERDGHIDRLLEVIDALKEISGQGDMEEAKKRQKILEERLEKTDSEMKDKLRQAEIEMSMERAKLAREASRLQQISSGGESSPQAENGSKPSAEEEASEDKGSRWSRFLGSK